MSKQAGRMSQSANDFLEPKAPVSVSVTNVPSGRLFNNGRADVTFSLPADSPAATSYTVTSTFVATGSGGDGSTHTGPTATGSSSPISVTGLKSGASYTFTVTATNASGTSAASSATGSVTITTVPATPSAPSASSPSAGIDRVSWSAPANGGSAITNYYWAASDGKSGNTTSTTVDVNQEQGSAQTYTVRADNANGNSGTSTSSGSVTTTFSFVPFSFTPYAFTPMFSFTPYAFTPMFSFTPFAFTPMYSFTPFSFTPMYSFTPFSFTPMNAYSFTPFSDPTAKSLGPDTLVLTTNGLTAAKNISVGDTLVSVELPGLGNNFDFGGVTSWSTENTEFDMSNTTITTVTHVAQSTASTSVLINGELFSGTHYMLTKRNGLASMVASKDLLNTDELWSTDANAWIPIIQLIVKDISHEVISINCEPYDMFFTDNFLVYDGYQTEN